MRKKIEKEWWERKTGIGAKDFGIESTRKEKGQGGKGRERIRGGERQRARMKKKNTTAMKINMGSQFQSVWFVRNFKTDD